MEYYKFLEDEYELQWFFDNVVKEPLPTEEYCFCIAARSKQLTPEEKIEYGLGRAEMLDTHVMNCRHFDYTRFKQEILKFEVNKDAILTNTRRHYPQKTLVCYFYINPCDSVKVLQSVKKSISDLEDDMTNAAIKLSADGIKDISDKIRHLFHKVYKVYPTCPGKKNYLDFDIDIAKEDRDRKSEILEVLKEKCNEAFDKGSYLLVDTNGGYHILVKKNKFKPMFNPKAWAKQMETAFENIHIDECIFNTNGFIPCPGTLQYGNVVRVVNKDDFDSND